MKVAVVGDHDSVIGFMTVGMEIFEVGSSDEAKETLASIFEDEKKRRRYGIVFIVESFATPLSDYILELRNKYPVPLITIIPGKSGSSGLQKELIRKKIERAIGFDIFATMK